MEGAQDNRKLDENGGKRAQTRFSTESLELLIIEVSIDKPFVNLRI